MASHVKETITQLISAIPLSFLMGNVLLEAIKDEYSGNNFVVSTVIYPQSYIIAVLSVINVSTSKLLFTTPDIFGIIAPLI